MNHLTIHPYSAFKSKTDPQPGKVATNDLDLQLLKEIWRVNYHALVAHASKILRENLLAEDIVTETFIKFWERRELFDHPYKIRKFLYVTVNNACIDHLRSKEFHELVHQELKYVANYVEETAENGMDKKYLENIQLLRIHLKNLPAACRKIFELYFFANCTTKEIACQLQLAEQTVLNQKGKAIKRLSTHLPKD